MQRLATQAGLSDGLVYLALRGERVSLESVLRLVGALGLKLEWELVDPRSRPVRERQDTVHSAMGEFEARHFRPMGFLVSIDEPYPTGRWAKSA